MVYRLTRPENVNVLIAKADWPWPRAVTNIFKPRRFNALVADSAAEMLRIVAANRIHLAILDAAEPGHAAMEAIRVIRARDRLLPFILLACRPDDRLLAEALGLGVFSVLDKPVDLQLLADQIDRLFLKCYGSNFKSQGDCKTQNC